MYGVLAAVLGAAAVAGFTLLSVVLNLIHNGLPVFIFIFPLVILGVMLVAPFSFGFASAWAIKKGCVAAECRSPFLAGSMAFLMASTGAGLFWMVAEAFAGPGKSFGNDVLVPFVGQMLASAITFDWGSLPEPVDVPSWIVFTIVGVAGGFGLLLAVSASYDVIRNTPYCEQCERYYVAEQIWTTTHKRDHDAVRALESMDEGALLILPESLIFKDHLRLDLWRCRCLGDGYADLVKVTFTPSGGEELPTSNEDRVYSRFLTGEQAKLVNSQRA